MATLTERLNDAFSRIANILETHRGNIGTLSSLTTTEKSNLVAAINEIVTSVENASPIDDSVTNTSKTWSSSKINTEISNAVATLINGADSDNDTLKELADKITALVSADNGLVSAVAAQSFTDAQKAQARSNIDAVSSNDVGDTDTNYVTVIDAIYGA